MSLRRRPRPARVRDIELVPAGGFARAFPAVLGACFLLGGVVAAVVAWEQWRVLLAALPVFAMAVAVAIGLGWAIRHPRARLEDDTLTLGRLPHVHVPVAALDLDAARIVNLDAEPGLRLAFRLFGTWVPGYNAGWFLLGDRRRAFALVTSHQRVLVLPRRDGGPILLSAAHPDALLATLRGLRR